MLSLPEHKRHLFRKPFGTLYSDITTVLPIIRGKTIYSVGDVVTKTLLEQGITPDLAIVDGYTMRLPCKIPRGPFQHICHSINPAGMISDDLIRCLDEVLPVQGSLIIVDGEEDLAVIPLVIRAACGSALIYGQPNQGIVVRIVDESAKQEAELLLSHFILSGPG